MHLSTWLLPSFAVKLWNAASVLCLAFSVIGGWVALARMAPRGPNEWSFTNQRLEGIATFVAAVVVWFIVALLTRWFAFLARRDQLDGFWRTIASHPKLRDFSSLDGGARSR